MIKGEFRVTKDTNFKGLQDLAKRLRDGSEGVLVGVPKGKTEEDGISVAQVAAWNEFGTGASPDMDRDTRRRLGGMRSDSKGLAGGSKPSGGLGIPERSFLRTGIRKNLGAFRALNLRSLKSIVRGGMSMDQALGLLGTLAAGKVKMEIRNGNHAPNAPSTIAAKGSDKPLIDDGQLFQSITYERDRGAANLRAQNEVVR